MLVYDTVVCMHQTKVFSRRSQSNAADINERSHVENCELRIMEIHLYLRLVVIMRMILL